ncbi:MAG TPA: HAD-IA family hydrolase [Myxococcales bacterium]|jgi:phosphoglycolate phosphatase
MDATLFDLDGTLIDSFVDIARSANHARSVVGLPPLPERQIFGYVGEGAQRLIERTIGPEHPELFPQAMAAWREHYEVHCLDTTRPYPGVVEALQRMEGPKALVTNKPGPAARKLAEALGLAPLLSAIVGGGDVANRKPDPEGCRLALSKLPRVERVVFVGDSVVDAQTAVNGGYGFVGVLWGMGTRDTLSACGAKVFAERAEELPEACRRARLP